MTHLSPEIPRKHANYYKIRLQVLGDGSSVKSSPTSKIAVRFAAPVEAPGVGKRPGVLVLGGCAWAAAVEAPHASRHRGRALPEALAATRFPLARAAWLRADRVRQ